MEKWLFALPRGGGAERTPNGAERCVRFASLPSDAPLAAAQGRPARPPRADGVLACWAAAGRVPQVAGGHGYRVEEILQWDRRERTPSPRVVFFFVRRRPDLSQEAFAKRYREGHTAVAREHHPGLVRYLQHFVQERSDGAPEWHAIAELHFAGERELREGFYRDASSAAAVDADVAGFVDTAHGLVLLTRECG